MELLNHGESQFFFLSRDDKIIGDNIIAKKRYLFDSASLVQDLFFCIPNKSLYLNKSVQFMKKELMLFHLREIFLFLILK